MWVARVMDQPYPHVVQSQVTRQAGNKSVQVEDEFGSYFLCTVGKLGIVCSYSHFWRCMYVCMYIPSLCSSTPYISDCGMGSVSREMTYH